MIGKLRQVTSFGVIEGEKQRIEPGSGSILEIHRFDRGYSQPLSSKFNNCASLDFMSSGSNSVNRQTDYSLKNNAAS